MISDPNSVLLKPATRRRALVVHGGASAGARDERAGGMTLPADYPVSDRPPNVEPMGDVISLQTYRDDVVAPREMLSRLDDAVAKLDPLVRAQASGLSPTVERELRAIAIAVNAGRPRQAARRAERLAGLLQHPASG